MYYLFSRYEGGLLVSAIDFIALLLQRYLEVELLFHKHDSEASAKILLNKRTEVEEASQLSIIARSHQAISQKNLLVIKLLGYIRLMPGKAN